MRTLRTEIELHRIQELLRRHAERVVGLEDGEGRRRLAERLFELAALAQRHWVFELERSGFASTPALTHVGLELSGLQAMAVEMGLTVDDGLERAREIGSRSHQLVGLLRLIEHDLAAADRSLEPALSRSA